MPTRRNLEDKVPLDGEVCIRNQQGPPDQMGEPCSDQFRLLEFEVALFAKLVIRPFSYGLIVQSEYDNGFVFNPEMLDMTEEDLIEKFAAGVSMVTSLALAISYPTLAAAPHIFINVFKNVMAIVVETDYSYPKADEVKEDLKDLSKFTVAVVAVVPAIGGAAAVDPSIWAALNLVSSLGEMGKSFIATVTRVVSRLWIWPMEKSCRLLACGYPWWFNVSHYDIKQ